MDPKILQAMGAIAKALQASHPQQAQEIMQWLQGGGVGALSGATLAMALPFGPTVGIPAVALLAGIRHAMGGGQPGGEVMQRVPGGGPGTGAGAVGANALPVTSPPAGAPPTGYGTMGYRGLVTGPSAAGTVGPSVFDNNQPGGAPGPAGSPGPLNVPGPAAATGGPQAPGSTPDFSNVVDEFGQPTSQNYGNTVATQQAGLRSQVQNQGGNGGSGGSNPPSGAGGNDNNPGGFSSGMGTQLSQDDNMLLQFALRAAGFDPNVATPAMKYAAKALQPLVQARRAAFGAGDNGQNLGALPQDIAAFAKEYTTPGANFYGHAQQYAQGLLGGKSFQDFIAGLSDPQDQYNMYQALVPLLYGGSNPMIQQSVKDQLRTQQNNYDWQDFNQQGQGQKSILDFIRNQPNLNPALRSIFGPQR